MAGRGVGGGLPGPMAEQWSVDLAGLDQGGQCKGQQLGSEVGSLGQVSATLRTPRRWHLPWAQGHPTAAPRAPLQAGHQ